MVRGAVCPERPGGLLGPPGPHVRGREVVASLLAAVFRGVGLGGLRGVVLGVQVVTMRRVGVVGGLLVRACNVVLVGFGVVVRGLRKVLGGLLVMVVFDHVDSFIRCSCLPQGACHAGAALGVVRQNRIARDGRVRTGLDAAEKTSPISGGSTGLWLGASLSRAR